MTPQKHNMTSILKIKSFHKSLHLALGTFQTQATRPTIKTWIFLSKAYKEEIISFKTFNSLLLKGINFF